ncbi:hypothetical protein [Alicyclobacillus vulcanalis]|uniref:hypothetical protein n=1 Tax=Alicyclobacillus vulcanalis TaxID=252246 RepID=UPI000970AF66|nr:hypothetical protein [Alicyclobacillus vulcanalis]
MMLDIRRVAAVFLQKLSSLQMTVGQRIDEPMPFTTLDAHDGAHLLSAIAAPITPVSPLEEARIVSPVAARERFVFFT